MKITIKHYDIEVSWSNDVENQIIDATTIDEIFNAFKGLLVSLGYHPNSIDSDILEQALQIENDSKEKKDL